mgnify:CR=1 FL=1
MNKLENMVVFFDKAAEGLEKGQMKEFTCPICNGKAKAFKSTYNGHLCASCKACKMSVHE